MRTSSVLLTHPRNPAVDALKRKSMKVLKKKIKKFLKKIKISAKIRRKIKSTGLK